VGPCIGVVAARVGARQPEAGQVHSDDAVPAFQSLRDGLPGVQAGGEAVDQQHGGRLARPGVAEVQADPQHLDELRGGCGIAGFESGRGLSGA
jgi:hypothetical protein